MTVLWLAWVACVVRRSGEQHLVVQEFVVIIDVGWGFMQWCDI